MVFLVALVAEALEQRHRPLGCFGAAQEAFLVPTGAFERTFRERGALRFQKTVHENSEAFDQIALARLLTGGSLAVHVWPSARQKPLLSQSMPRRGGSARREVRRRGMNEDVVVVAFMMHAFNRRRRERRCGLGSARLQASIVATAALHWAVMHLRALPIAHAIGDGCVAICERTLTFARAGSGTAIPRIGGTEVWSACLEWLLFCCDK